MSKRKKISLSILTMLVLLLMITGGIVYKVYLDVKQTADVIYEPVEREDDRKIDVTKNQPFSILLLGVDTGNFGRTGQGSSDSIMIATINPNDNSAKLTSIPRDTRTELVGLGIQDKITYAHAYGGMAVAMDTVEKLVNIPIDYYVQVNMKGFEDIVNAVGGIAVNNERQFTQDGTTFKKGNIYLNGSDALKYSRMRKEDPRADFGRQARQRQVIESILKKSMSISTITNYSSILDALGGNIKTSFDVKTMMKIQKDYGHIANNIEQVQVKGSETFIDGIYYHILSEKERLNVSQTLRQHLEL